MPNYTDNLELFKYDVEADKKSTFNIGLALNDNFDKIDAKVGEMETQQANIDLSNLSTTGNSKLNAKANIDLSNLSTTGNSKIESILPVGSIITSARDSSPAGFLLCNGSAISRTTYAKLFSAIGTTYGSGDGSTTFNLPNYSNYNFVTSATVSIKGTGKTLGFTNGTQNFGMTCRYQGSANFPYTNTALYNVNVGTLGSAGNIDTTHNASIGVTTDASKSGITGSVNTATLKWYIKY